MRALRLYRILDSGAEQLFDDLTRLAATICETPISLVSLVDEERQWFKSRFGLETPETHREYAFCAHAILDDELMVVEDARNDERFAHNPLVTGEPSIRFYAGAPLVVRGGARLGTLCVIDNKPRTLTPQQAEALQILRCSVVTQLELNRARHELRALEHLLPMCAWCRSIRVEQSGEAAWRSLDEYVKETMSVTHGICPECTHFLDLEESPE